MSSGAAGHGPLVLFVCRHGAAKSVLAAAQLERDASAAGLAIEVRSAGVEPDAQVAPAVLDCLAGDVEPTPPRKVAAGDVARAWRTITLDLEPSDLPAIPGNLERWDGLPSAGDDPSRALSALRPHLDRLVGELRGVAAEGDPSTRAISRKRRRTASRHA